MKDDKAIFARIQACAARAFDVESALISEQASSDTLEQWDSLGHINLIAEVEAEFGIRFSMDEIPGLGSMEKLCSAVRQRLEQ